MKKLILILFPLFLLCGSLVSCSDGDSGSGETEEQQEQQEQQLVKSYGGSLNIKLKNTKTNETKTFHRVSLYNSVDNGDNTYNVKEHEIHYFATSNSDYTNLTISELCEIVENGSVENDSKYNYTLKEDRTISVKNSTRKYLLPAGLEYAVYYYF